MANKRPPQHPKSVWDERLLVETLDRHDVKISHARTIWRSLMQSQGDFAALEGSTLPKRILPILKEEFTYCSSRVRQLEQSALDGTIKLLLKLQDGCEIEAVIINQTGEDIHGMTADGKRTTQEIEGGRKTLCVSSQVGCRLGCTFCATGTMKLEGNVTAGEIMEQILLADHVLNSIERWREAGGAGHIKPEESQELVDSINASRTPYRSQHISNVVFMGMGEPLQNFDHVVDSLQGLTDPTRFALAIRNCTVSTVGIVDRMRQLMVKMPSLKMALSLHAPNQQLREQIVPVSKSYHIDLLMAEIDDYAARHASDGKRKGWILVAYIMIDGVNDTEENLQQLIALMKGRQVTLNLIPFNKFDPYSAGSAVRKTKVHPAEAYEASRAETMIRWMTELQANDIRAFERRPHGRDISAACGQLAKISRPDATLLQSISSGDIEDGIFPLSRSVVRKSQLQPEQAERKSQLRQRALLLGLSTALALAAAGAWALRRRVRQRSL